MNQPVGGVAERGVGRVSRDNRLCRRARTFTLRGTPKGLSSNAAAEIKKGYSAEKRWAGIFVPAHKLLFYGAEEGT